MVEQVIYKDKPIQNKKDRKSLIIGFYIWNLNLYITSLLSFNNWFLVGFFIYLINIFCFRTLFGRFQNLNSIFIYHILITILYIYNFGILNWRMILIIITSLINVSYYIYILDDGKKFKKIINKD